MDSQYIHENQSKDENNSEEGENNNAEEIENNK